MTIPETEVARLEKLDQLETRYQAALNAAQQARGPWQVSAAQGKADRLLRRLAALYRGAHR
jgi:hypothetical protein